MDLVGTPTARWISWRNHEFPRRKYLGALLAWVIGGAVVNGYTPSMEIANLLAPFFAISFGAAIIWKHRLVQIGVLVLTYAQTKKERAGVARSSQFETRRGASGLQ